MRNGKSRIALTRDLFVRKVSDKLLGSNQSGSKAERDVVKNKAPMCFPEGDQCSTEDDGGGRHPKEFASRQIQIKQCLGESICVKRAMEVSIPN